MMTKENGDLLMLEPPNGQTPEASANAPARQAPRRTGYIYKDGPPVPCGLHVERDLFDILEHYRKFFGMSRNAFAKLLLRRAIAANMHLLRK